MNIKRFVLGSLAVFVFIHLAEFVFHAMIMSNSYNAHIDVLRPEAEAGSMMPYMSLGFLILSFGFSWIFVHGYKGTGIMEGVRYGFYAAIAFGFSSSLINVAVFPWPREWIVAWLVGETIIMMAAGAVIAAIYKPKTA